MENDKGDKENGLVVFVRRHPMLISIAEAKENYEGFSVDLARNNWTYGGETFDINGDGNGWHIIGVFSRETKNLNKIVDTAVYMVEHSEWGRGGGDDAE